MPRFRQRSKILDYLAVSSSVINSEKFSVLIVYSEQLTVGENKVPRINGIFSLTILMLSVYPNIPMICLTYLK